MAAAAGTGSCSIYQGAAEQHHCAGGLPALLKCVLMQLQEALWCWLRRGTQLDTSLLQIPVGKDFRLSGKAVKRAITSNTILVVASSPGFPHGVMDHVQEIAQVSAESTGGMWACIY